ncbi:MAG: hypothetical protein LUE86_01365 [Clostridiales bacterium]|nr:hypothetical protein [Clostridiales bacterium]
MSTPLLIGIMWGAIILFFIGFLIFRTVTMRRATGGRVRFITGKDSRNRLYIFYTLFKNTPFLNREFNKVQARYRILYPSDEMSVNRAVTTAMTRSCVIFLAITLGSILISQGDVFFIIFGIFTAVILWRSSITGRLDAADQRILVEFSEFVSGLIPAYREYHGHLEDAIYSMLDDLPPLISLHMSVIYDILSSPDAEAASERYTDYAPNRFLLSFVSLAVPVKIYGDKTLEDGNTAFLNGLMHLKKELNEEIIKRNSIDMAFSSLTIIAVAAVFAMKPVEWFFLNFMPETVTFFTGPAGIAITTLIFVTAYACYSMILSLKTTKRDEVIETSIWQKIASLPRVNEILNTQMNRHYTAWTRKEKQLRAIGDHTGIKSFMVKSAAYAVAAFIGVNLLCSASGMQAANNALTQVSQSFSSTVVPNENYTAEMERVATELIKRHRAETAIDESLLASEIRSMSEYLKADTYVTPVVNAVVSHVQEYHEVYFRWYYELFAVAAAIFAFFIPTMFLRFQSNQIQMSKEDEVNSFNLLALIFMDLDGTQVSTVLEWMERFSYSFRDAITDCIVNLEMGQRKALQQLYEYDDMFEFRKFVKSLMAVDDIGFRSAFADIQIQQDYYNEKRRLDNQQLIMKKSSLASRIAFIPMYMVIGFYLILPMISYGISMAGQLTTLMGQL